MEKLRKIIRQTLSEQVIKQSGVDFHSSDHLVLPFESMIDPIKYPHFPYRNMGDEPLNLSTTVFSMTHPDGWTITGKVTDWEDFFQGVEDFIAHHPKFGSVSGNFDN